tara:strand:+ start:1025 stop:1642 length:618 start_codon:yes stop_codon:yes gene_type:complete
MKWHHLIKKQVDNLEFQNIDFLNMGLLSKKNVIVKPLIHEHLYKGMINADDKILAVPSLQLEQHPIESMTIFSEWNTDFIAVCDDQIFIGLLGLKDLVNIIGKQWCFQESGSTIWFKSPVNKPFSSDLMKSIELENINIINFSVDLDQETGEYLNFIRVDQRDPNQTIQTLERLGCQLIGYYPKGIRRFELKENLEHLTYFLNIE